MIIVCGNLSDRRAHCQRRGDCQDDFRHGRGSSARRAKVYLFALETLLFFQSNLMCPFHLSQLVYLSNYQSVSICLSSLSFLSIYLYISIYLYLLHALIHLCIFSIPIPISAPPPLPSPSVSRLDSECQRVERALEAECVQRKLQDDRIIEDAEQMESRRKADVERIDDTLRYVVGDRDCHMILYLIAHASPFIYPSCIQVPKRD